MQKFEAKVPNCAGIRTSEAKLKVLAPTISSVEN